MADDDGSLSITAGLAKEAALFFQAGKFGDCLKVLNQLLQKKENDPKVIHNVAIAENFQDGCLDPKRLLEVLHNVKKRSEELALTSGEHVEAVSSLGSKGTIGTKGPNSMVHQFSAANSSSIVYNDEFDTSVTLFNIAVTWFHLHEYANSFSTLEPLYQNIEPIDEGTALRICLLLLDIALLSHHATRAADVISYIEKVFCVNTMISQGDNGSSAPQQSAALVTKSSSFSNYTPIPDSSNSDSANASESPLSRTLSEDAEYENLFSTLDISGQNLRRPSSVFQSSNDLPRTQADDLISTADLRLKLHLYKVRFLLLTRNPKAAKREVKMAMNVARGKDYSTALFLKSQLEYARGNHRKAIKLLMASSNRTDMGTSSIIYYNNLGCINYRLGKHNTSAVFFSKALSSSSSLRKENPKNLSTFSNDKSLLIIYNCGVQYLACEKPILAARCFHKASLIFYNRPLLWLRLAECCLMAHEKGLLNRLEINVNVIGKGKYRQLVLEDGISEKFVGRDDLFTGDGKSPNLSMTLARQCLVNALHLLDFPELKYLKSGLTSNLTPVEENESKETVKLKNTVGQGQVNVNGEMKEQKSGGSNLNATLQGSITDYEEICRREHQMIKQAVLADLAFVELELGNPLKSLSVARSLLKLPECSRIYAFLGNVYAAEALCLLNRPKEAFDYLSVYLSGGDGVELPYGQEDCDKWRAEKTFDCEDPVVPLDESRGDTPATRHISSNTGVLKSEEARGILYANLAAMSAMQGDLDGARRFVTRALSAIPGCPDTILTSIYVDLASGRTQEALVKLKQCSCVRFVSGGLTVNGSC